MPMPVRFHLLCAAVMLALAGCAGDGREAREPANALLLEGLMAGAMADCSRRLEAGEFATHVERARCEGVEARGSVEGLGMEYAFGDLVALLSEWRLRLARERDAGTLEAAGERARQKEFEAAFLREMDVRERLHNDGVSELGFNYCYIEGNGLNCTVSPAEEIVSELDARTAECEWLYDIGGLATARSLAICAYDEGLADIFARYNHPHLRLAKLISAYMVELAGRFDGKHLGLNQYAQYTDAIWDQYDREIENRKRLRAAGDLNWRNRECLISEEELRCEPHPPRLVPGA